MADNVSTRDIMWLAGLLEGEGCFTTGRKERANASIQLIMTDPDVVERAARIMDANYAKRTFVTSGGKATYRSNVYGPHAIGWMMTLYQFMGVRRRQQIVCCIERWKAAPGRSSMKKYARAHLHRVAA